MKPQINIVASTNEEEKKNKLLQVNEMLVFFNKDLIQYHVQSRDEEISSKLNGGSLTIHSQGDVVKDANFVQSVYLSEEYLPIVKRSKI